MGMSLPTTWICHPGPAVSWLSRLGTPFIIGFTGCRHFCCDPQTSGEASVCCLCRGRALNDRCEICAPTAVAEAASAGLQPWKPL